MPKSNSNKNFNPREFMELAIKVMESSIQEPRDDKVSPKVGAVLIKKDGTIETAYRGELREGDHAEFTLLERKNRMESLEGAVLFATLEPCAPGARKHPKLGCAERIVNARIKEVWVGVEDPDPTVDRKGIKFLQENGVTVHMFDSDLQALIRNSNKQFIEEAEERAKIVKEESSVLLTEKEKAEPKAKFDDLSHPAISDFIQKAKLNASYDSDQFNRIFAQLGFLELINDEYVPTGIGFLLFGENPQWSYPNAMIRAVFKTGTRVEKPVNFEGPITSLSQQALEWYADKMNYEIDRSTAERQKIYDYPPEVIREAITNAIVHRDYDIEGAPIYFEINDNSIIIKSPGFPVEPIKLEQIQRFNAPSLSRNPKIMYAFDQLELVEQRGLGFDTIRSLPEEYDLPLPIVTFDEPYLVFTFPRSREALRLLSVGSGIEELSELELKGIELVKSMNEISTSEYADKLEVSQRTASRHLKKFLDLNLVKTNDESPKSPKLRYIAI